MWNWRKKDPEPVLYDLPSPITDLWQVTAPETPDGRLMIAIGKKEYDGVKAALKDGAKADLGGGEPLFLAGLRENAAIAGLLVANGASVDQTLDLIPGKDAVLKERGSNGSYSWVGGWLRSHKGDIRAAVVEYQFSNALEEVLRRQEAQEGQVAALEKKLEDATKPPALRERTPK